MSDPAITSVVNINVHAQLLLWCSFSLWSLFAPEYWRTFFATFQAYWLGALYIEIYFCACFETLTDTSSLVCTALHSTPSFSSFCFRYFEIIEILEGHTSQPGDLCLLIWPVPAYVFLDFDSKETSNVAELSHPEILLHLVVNRHEFSFGCCSDNHVVNVNKECILLRLLLSSACINIDPSYLVWIPMSCKSNQLRRTA